MDSRIRELEQWLAEAKRDLGECGQEAYLQKLYLLDAEIRAVIKANGAHAGMDSPSRAGGLVRGHAPAQRGVPATRKMAWALGVSGVALLAAATVTMSLPALQSGSSLLARNFSLSGFNTANSGQPQADSDPLTAGQSSTTPPAGFVPASIPGEEILPADWTPGSDELMSGMLLADSQLSADDASILAGPVVDTHSVPARMGVMRPQQGGLSSRQLGAIMASQPATLPHEETRTEASVPVRSASGPDANQAIDVMMAGLGSSAGNPAASTGRSPAAADSGKLAGDSRGEMMTLHGEVPISRGGGLGERAIGRWNFDSSNFMVPVDYQPTDTASIQKNKRSKKNKQKAQSAGGAKPAEPVRETRPGDAEEIKVSSEGDKGSSELEQGAEGAES
ncbi:hypothetical protein IT575_13510 [bacterium]|nr:hypothetical protein [bacterium]